MPGPMMNIPSAAMPMVGPAPSAEDQAKMMFSQRAAQTMVQAANQDAAFQQQLAATKYARAHAKVAQGLVLPKAGPIGMTESGATVRQGDQPSGGPDFRGGYTADSIARKVARTEQFDPSMFHGQSMFTDLPEIMSKTLDKRAEFEREARSAADVDRGLDLARGKVAPGVWKHGLLSEDSVAERDMGQLQGTIEKPLGLARPGAVGQYAEPGIESQGPDGEVPLAEVLRHLQARMPMQRGY